MCTTVAHELVKIVSNLWTSLDFHLGKNIGMKKKEEEKGVNPSAVV